MVRDDHGRALALEPADIGQGGQGRVYRVRDSRLAVKVVNSMRWRPEVAEELKSRLRAVSRLPLDGLPLSRPVAHLVEPHVGYVMELLESVVPLAQVGRAPADVDISGWYLQGGGLARRLRVLTRLAWVLASLHGRGIVYGDPSPTNIVISGRTDRDHLWLIDTDNLAVTADAARDIGGTPGYGAPELASSSTRLSTLSDAFAFAVLAFEVLVSLHPFTGDQVHDDDETVLGREAMAFQLPWVDHTTDDSNRLSYGISREWVLTRSLRELFQETFEDGLRTPRARPGMSAWYAALARAADATRSCSSCQHTFYVDRPMCPWCGTAASPVVVGRVFVQLRRRDFSSENGETELALADTRDLVVVEQDRWASISTRTGRLVPQGDPFEPVAAARWDGKERLMVHNPGTVPFHLVSQDGRNRKRVVPREQLPVTVRPGSATWLLHLTDRLNAPHRLVVFDVHGWQH
ncbi:protein kinase domain-containing protein [Amycolatopsis sp. NPDC003861]